MSFSSLCPTAQEPENNHPTICHVHHLTQHTFHREGAEGGRSIRWSSWKGRTEKRRDRKREREESCQKMNPAESRSKHKRHSWEWIVKDECVVSYGSQTPFFLQDGWSSMRSRWHYSPRNNPVNREITLCTDTIHKKIEGGKRSECDLSLAKRMPDTLKKLWARLNYSLPQWGDIEITVP